MCDFIERNSIESLVPSRFSYITCDAENKHLLENIENKINASLSRMPNEIQDFAASYKKILLQGTLQHPL